MKKIEAENAFKHHRMVQHIESPEIAGYIRCFDDEETGVYLEYHYVFVELRKLQQFDVHAYTHSI